MMNDDTQTYQSQLLEKLIRKYKPFLNQFCQIAVDRKSETHYFKGKILDVDVVVSIDDFRAGPQSFQTLTVTGIRLLTEREIQDGIIERRPQNISRGGQQ